MGPFNAHVQLPMASHGPIIFLEAAANGLGWAYFNTLGWLLMASCAPIIFLRAAANALRWAHHFSRGCCDALGWAYLNAYVKLPVMSTCVRTASG